MTGERATIILGLEHFLDKVGYQAQEYAARGLRCLFLVGDVSGASEAIARKYGAQIEIVSMRSMANRLAHTVRAFRRVRPTHCELYVTGRASLAYAWISKLFGAKLIVFCRGSEVRQIHNRGCWGMSHSYAIRQTLRLADAIVAKELGMIPMLAALGVRGERVHHIPNAVSLPTVVVPFERRDIDVLFLNSVIRMRNVLMLVRAWRGVMERLPGRRLVMCGFSTIDRSEYKVEAAYEKEVLAEIGRLGLSSCIEIHGFIRNPQDFLQRARVFVLPANVVYANYALLEAMSYAVVPVVGDGEGANRIVQHNINGLIVERSERGVERGLVYLLTSDNIERMAGNARKTVAEMFSIAGWCDAIGKVYA